MRLWQDTISSTLFLSRLPVARFLAAERQHVMPDFGETAHSFPLAGGVIGILPAALVLGGGWLGLDGFIVAWMAIAVFVITTGALHEDGLADVADGFWGGHEKARKLAIMRDSAIGTYGVLALILSVGLKATTLGIVLREVTPAQGATLMIVACALSRTAMLYPWHSLPNARDAVDETKDEAGKTKAGLSSRFGEPNFHTYLRGCLWCLPFLALLWASCGIAALVLGLGLVKLATLVATRLARHHIGGHTGDVLGATQQVAELAFWAGLAMAFALIG
ncbi:MAG: adenosylcobinamide-GDP ribazoletransferase [Pseudomonadota bacterium]